jgi:hypothetical protein
MLRQAEMDDWEEQRCKILHSIAPGKQVADEDGTVGKATNAAQIARRGTNGGKISGPERDRKHWRGFPAWLRSPQEAKSDADDVPGRPVHSYVLHDEGKGKHIFLKTIPWCLRDRLHDFGQEARHDPNFQKILSSTG